MRIPVRRVLFFLDIPELTHVKVALRNIMTEWQLARASAKSLRTCRKALAGKKGLQLELGGGAGGIRPGWINIDIAFAAPYSCKTQLNGTEGYINSDLRARIPLENECVSKLFMSHILEHFDYREGVKLLREVYRCMQPGGQIRVVMPDYSAFFKACVARNEEILCFRSRAKRLAYILPGAESIADYISLGVYENGQHKWIHDADSLCRLLSVLGFRNVSLDHFRPECLDVPIRAKDSFVVVAEK